jgi:hypothetical protein
MREEERKQNVAANAIDILYDKSLYFDRVVSLVVYSLGRKLASSY